PGRTEQRHQRVRLLHLSARLPVFPVGLCRRQRGRHVRAGVRPLGAGEPVVQPMTRPVLRCAIYLAVLALAAVVAMPMYWLVVSALKSSDEIFTATPRWLPATLDWENFAAAWQGAAFGRYFINSVAVAAAILLLQLTTASLAAFALARRRFAGRGVILFAV